MATATTEIATQAMPVRIEAGLYQSAKAQASAEHRTIAGQIQYWAKVGRTALDNPDLPIDFIKDLLVANAEDPKLATRFIPRAERT